MLFSCSVKMFVSECRHNELFFRSNLLVLELPTASFHTSFLKLATHSLIGFCCKLTDNFWWVRSPISVLDYDEVPV